MLKKNKSFKLTFIPEQSKSTKYLSLNSLIKDIPIKNHEKLKRINVIKPPKFQFNDSLKLTTLDKSTSIGTNQISLNSKNINKSTSSLFPTKRYSVSRLKLKTIDNSPSIPRLKNNLLKNNALKKTKKYKIYSPLFLKNKKEQEKADALKRKIERSYERKRFIDYIKRDFTPILKKNHKENQEILEILKKKMGMIMNEKVYLTKNFYPYFNVLYQIKNENQLELNNFDENN